MVFFYRNFYYKQILKISTLQIDSYFLHCNVNVISILGLVLEDLMKEDYKCVFKPFNGIYEL